MISRRSVFSMLGASWLLPGPALAHETPAEQGVREASFRSVDGVLLRGALYLPVRAKPRASLVVVHGAGERPSRYEDWARVYSGAGFATLIYDKRGCGESGGVYQGARNTSADNLKLLTDDAIAAGRWLVAQDPAGSKLGFVGPSQAGWIVPSAALGLKAAFMALLSGPVCRTSESQEFEAQGRPGPLSYAKWLREESDTDPLPVLRQLAIPGYWIFGGKDQNVPVDLSVRNLDSLISAGHRYGYYIDPAAGHFHGEPAHRRVIAWLDDLLSVASSGSAAQGS